MAKVKAWDTVGKWKRRFLIAMRESGSVVMAAKAADRERSGCYLAKKKDPAFSKAWDEARDEWLERKMRDELQSSVTTRAIEGWLEPVYYQGAVVGAVRKYSDTLAIFLLKTHLREQYAQPEESRDRPSDFARMAVEFMDMVKGKTQGSPETPTPERYTEEKIGDTNEDK